MTKTTVNLLLQGLQEEAAEVIQEASKCVRFGPTDKWKKVPTPGARLANELIDLKTYIYVLEQMIDQDLLGTEAKVIMSEKSQRTVKKLQKIQRWIISNG